VFYMPAPAVLIDLISVGPLAGVGLSQLAIVAASWWRPLLLALAVLALAVTEVAAADITGTLARIVELAGSDEWRTDRPLEVGLPPSRRDLVHPAVGL
jgi:hypothetical protein